MAAQTNQESLFQKFGFTEMYEWATIPQPANKFGRFVQVSKRYPDKVEPTHDSLTHLIGVSTICSVIESDNPQEWKNTFMFNEVGDFYMKEETLAVGVKQYDQDLEMAYIMTKPWKHHIKIINPKYNKELKYVPRTNRPEWVRVTILGKAIVCDNGQCTPGEYCQPYYGEDMQRAGCAIPAIRSAQNSFYVLERVSPTTIKILVK